MGKHSAPQPWPWWKPSGAWFLYGVGFGLVAYGVAVGVYTAVSS